MVRSTYGDMNDQRRFLESPLRQGCPDKKQPFSLSLFDSLPLGAPHNIFVVFLKEGEALARFLIFMFVLIFTPFLKKLVGDDDVLWTGHNS